MSSSLQTTSMPFEEISSHGFLTQYANYLTTLCDVTSFGGPEVDKFTGEWRDIFRTPPPSKVWIVTLQEFFYRLLQYMSCSDECFGIAACLVARWAEKSKSVINWSNVHRLVSVGLVLAVKMWDDEVFGLSFYASVAVCATAAEFRKIETQFLKDIDWNVWISGEDYRVMTQSGGEIPCFHSLLTTRDSPSPATIIEKETTNNNCCAAVEHEEDGGGISTSIVLLVPPKSPPEESTMPMTHAPPSLPLHRSQSSSALFALADVPHHSQNTLLVTSSSSLSLSSWIAPVARTQSLCSTAPPDEHSSTE